jgi:hypothetical protein
MHRTLFVRVSAWKFIRWRKHYLVVGIPWFVTVFAFLPWYALEYGGVQKALDQMLRELTLESYRIQYRNELLEEKIRRFESQK